MLINDVSSGSFPTLDQLRDGTASRESVKLAYGVCAEYFRHVPGSAIAQFDEYIVEDNALACAGDVEAALRLQRDFVAHALYVLGYEKVVERRAVEARELEFAASEAARSEAVAGDFESANLYAKLAVRAAREAVGAVDFINRSDAEHPEEACMLYHKLCGLSVPCPFAFA